MNVKPDYDDSLGKNSNQMNVSPGTSTRNFDVII